MIINQRRNASCHATNANCPTPSTWNKAVDYADYGRINPEKSGRPTSFYLYHFLHRAVGSRFQFVIQHACSIHPRAIQRDGIMAFGKIAGLRRQGTSCFIKNRQRGFGSRRQVKADLCF